MVLTARLTDLAARLANSATRHATLWPTRKERRLRRREVYLPKGVRNVSEAFRDMRIMRVRHARQRLQVTVTDDLRCICCECVLLFRAYLSIIYT